MDYNSWKFRGQRIDTKEWVIGYYIHYGSIHGIIPIESLKYTCNGEALDFNYINVNPDTVGIYLELDDINCVEVYQYDKCIVTAKDRYVHDNILLIKDSTFIGIICMSDFNWVIQDTKLDFEYLPLHDVLYENMDIEVVGTLFD